MERELSGLLPIWGVEQDCILSKVGDYTAAFEVTKPEIFTLSADEYESLLQTLLKAIKVLPQHSVFHLQDWYTEARYKSPAGGPTPGFLERAGESHFEDRPYLEHRSYLYLTKKPQGRKAASSATSGLLRRTLVPEETLNPTQVREFLDSIGQFQRIVEDGKQWGLRRLTEDEIWSNAREIGILEQYCYLASPGETGMIRDLSFDRGFTIGDRHCQLYTLADAEKLPAHCNPHVPYPRYSTDKTPFPVGFSAGLGALLRCNHIFNQYIFIGDGPATLKKLESKSLRLQSLSKASRANAVAKDAVDAFLNESVKEHRLPVKAHFNVLAWTENPAGLKEIKNKVSSAMAQLEAAPHQETVGVAQIWWAGIPGNAADFPMNETHDTFPEQAICFLNLETNYRSAPRAEGIRFCDRLSGKPVWVDLFDAPRRAGITSNMGVLVCGTSGGGKSMTVNHVLRTLYDQGSHCVTVDIGGSYKGLCDLVGGYYFTYEEKNPIRFNPFYVGTDEGLDTEKKESLKALLVALWKQDHETFNRAEYIALSNALQGYYEKLNANPTLFPCFNSFYEYLESDYIAILKGHRVKDQDFDVDNFLYVLRPYYQGGEFDYLLNATENLDLLQQPFIVFELDNIKDHPILFPVVTLIIMELFISKMRKLKGKRKVLTIDEAWKAIAKPGMAEFLKYAFKTIRKFNGIPIVITQELDDLVSSPIIKDAIINNADIKILMDMRKFVNKFDRLQVTLGLSEKGKTILLSVNKDNREIYIDIGGQIMKVFKNELSPHEYYAYTTEGKEKVMVMEYAARYGSMEKGIEALVAEKK